MLRLDTACGTDRIEENACTDDVLKKATSLHDQRPASR